MFNNLVIVYVNGFIMYQWGLCFPMVFAKLGAMKSERTKKCIQGVAGKSADELFQTAMEKVTT